MKYSIVYADPAWHYRDKASAGARGAEFKYPVMTVDEVMALPVKEHVADDAFLFLWTTWPILPEIFEKGLFEAWGFSYRTVGFIWIKTNPSSPGLFTGMGHWSRSNSEPCLLGIRGRPSRFSAGVHSVIMSPVREHSRKPDEARKRIVRLCGDLPRLELFARQRAEGWDAWGNEIKSDIIMQST